jgi:hypothetical protein
MKTTLLLSRNRFLSFVRIASAGTLLTAAAAMAVFAAKPSSQDAESSGPVNGVYIVQMKLAPAAGYRGEIPGYNATAPRQGQKIDPLAADTVRYVGYLKGKHDEALRKVGGGRRFTTMQLALMVSPRN